MAYIKAKALDNETAGVSRGKKVFRWSLIVTGILAALIAIGLAVSVSYSNIETIDRFMLDSKPWLGYWRLLLFAAVFGGWNRWSAMYAVWVSMSAEQLDLMIGYRWRMAAWVLVMEAVFSQHVLIDFVNNLLQAGAAS